MFISDNNVVVTKSWLVFLFNKAFSAGDKVMVEDDYGNFQMDATLSKANYEYNKIPSVMTEMHGKVKIDRIFPFTEYENLTRKDEPKSCTNA